MSPLMSISMMDNFFGSEMGGFNGGFTSISSFNGSTGGSGVKRTSTSTTFVNGKKVMTKR
jgi:DnaJ homolog subfamily B member 6